MSGSAGARIAAVAQGAQYVGTGVWALVSLESFQKVTGPKVDRWLVRTFGVLVGVVGAVLVMAGVRGRLTPEIQLLGAGTAAGIGAAEGFYSLKGRISVAYFVDALLQAVFLAAWLRSSRSAPSSSGDGRERR